MAHFTRREFLKTGLAAGTLAVSGGLPLVAQRGSATDMVTLGRSGVKVSRLAFGTGTFSGRVQRTLGQEGFTRLVRHAYDRGIRFFETAESYGEMHKMLGIALKGLPRDSYQLMSKVTTRDGVDPQQKLDELRRLEKAGQRYDTIVLDPPAFAKNKASVPNALAGYKEINLRAMRLLSPGGYLVTCSCSYNVNEDMFADVLHEASVDSHTPVTLVEKRMQGRDHPVLVGAPETYYLKCFILRRVE